MGLDPALDPDELCAQFEARAHRRRSGLSQLQGIDRAVAVFIH
jgi:hypothetical protein